MARLNKSLPCLVGIVAAAARPVGPEVGTAGGPGMRGDAAKGTRFDGLDPSPGPGSGPGPGLVLANGVKAVPLVQKQQASSISLDFSKSVSSKR